MKRTFYEEISNEQLNKQHNDYRGNKQVLKGSQFNQGGLASLRRSHLN